MLDLARKAFGSKEVGRPAAPVDKNDSKCRQMCGSVDASRQNMHVCKTDEVRMIRRMGCCQNYTNQLSYIYPVTVSFAEKSKDNLTQNILRFQNVTSDQPMKSRDWAADSCAGGSI